MSAGIGYVCSIYVEGGDHDGESFAIGPYADFAAAERAMTEVASHGHAEVLPCVDVAEFLGIVS